VHAHEVDVPARDEADHASDRNAPVTGAQPDGHDVIVS
jgi:hypothetical protein